jgi:protein N-terminal glutamine amidohydrolase
MRMSNDSLRERLRAQHYTHCYCEENVARLLSSRVPEMVSGTCYAVFVTNASRSVRVFETVWDYHVVILAVFRDGGALVFDLDALPGVPLPVDLSTYVSAAFPGDASPPLQPRFRVVLADTFLAHFASDRRHMRGPHGRWLATPPLWPCFRGPQSASSHNLDEWLDVSNALPSSDRGRVVVGAEELIKFISTGS